MLNHRHGLCQAGSRLGRKLQLYTQQLVKALFMISKVIVQASVGTAQYLRPTVSQPGVWVSDGFLHSDGTLIVFHCVLWKDVYSLHSVQQGRIPAGRVPGKIRFP